ncbi:hypothetical protein SAMN05444365_103483 [Micromonospora pattaloongensis]|uniref:Uncharacterized protein n=1 Tax=Micromonospora pattaloongensis TaxID=405436 RepID=A0A1H3MQQ8_9ACTN|nr:hypothetical protein [Micromonospora pattaloongensis]SDY78926.1 hypothetical protein SAMN05444365_103483 [Micromonospora pattaloongensis]
MDETGQPGSAAPGDNGNGPGRDDRGRPGTGWAASDAAWSSAGAALGPGPDPVVSAWRQAEPGAPRGWADPPARYTELLGPPPLPETREGSNGVAHAPRRADPGPLALPAPASAPPYPYEGDLEDAARDRAAAAEPSAPQPPSGAPVPDTEPAARHALDTPAPPDAGAGLARWRETPPPPRALSGAPTPAEQPTPTGRQVPPEFRVQPGTERPRFDLPAEPRRPDQRPAEGEAAPRWRTGLTDPVPGRDVDPAPARAVEPALRRDTAVHPEQTYLGAETGQPGPASSGYDTPPAFPGPAPAQSDRTPAGPVGAADDTLPQRVPAEPDVPTVPEPPAVEPPAETPDLSRIATHLRREDVPPQPRERSEGFDVNAILAAVRGVAGVRDASLRTTPAGAHSLRLDLADGADPAEVSRHVARLLQERMGLAAAPQNLPDQPVAGGPYVPAQLNPQRGAGAVGHAPAEAPRRRRRAVEEADATTVGAGQWAPEFPAPGAAAGVIGSVGGAPVSAGASYSGAQLTTTEVAPPRPLNTNGRPGPRVVIDHVQVSTFGMDATVEVRLAAGRRRAAGLATGPAVDGYVLRLCAVAAASAVDELLRVAEKSAERGRCFVEQAAVVPLGSCEVATVVVLLVCDGWVEQLVGSALVAGDPRQAAVRATLAAVNRRLEGLLA